ncbi:MAG TPA: hypothetical protein PLZ57_10780 [Pseudobdellovibrionaceae bacterium]|nr:hypothetical protein [Pseudobdellovibrionaceae bacterium]
MKSLSFPWPKADEREVRKFWEEFLQQLESAQGMAPTWSSPTSWLEVWRREEPRSWPALFKLRNEVLNKIEREIDFVDVQPSAEPRGLLLDDLQKWLWPSDFRRETDCPRCLARWPEAAQLVSHLKSCRS